MKKVLHLGIVAILLASLSSCVVSSKPSIDFFNTSYYREQANFTSINVPTFLAKNYLKTQLRNDGESQEVIDLVKKVSKVKLMMSDHINANIITDFNQHLKDQKFEEWASIKNDGNIIKINALQNDDMIKNLMITINSKDNNAVFVDVRGKFTADDISKLINATEKSNIKVKFN
ncbi:DUF4252 domain-containing protein [Chryseobacterium sp. T1]